MASILKSNSLLRRDLGEEGYEFLVHALGSVNRILPHTTTSNWALSEFGPSRATWPGADRKEIHLSVGIEDGKRSASLESVITRSKTNRSFDNEHKALDSREHAVCVAIAERMQGLLRGISDDAEHLQQSQSLSLAAIKAKFDEQVIAAYLKHRHEITLDVVALLDSIHKLAEMTYENSSIAFGCVIDSELVGDEFSQCFPYPLLEQKKYRALSDGYKTAYHVSGDGRLHEFIDLDSTKKVFHNSHGQNFPYWSDGLASMARHGRCSIALTRHGDILVFDEGTLRFSYRYGKWQYWNHAHLIGLIKSMMRGPRLPTNTLGVVAGVVYRGALDVSFRRTGGLFVVLHKESDLYKIVRPGDAVGDHRPGSEDKQFDLSLPSLRLSRISRPILAELASLDGAVVANRKGDMLAYGSVLALAKRTGIRGAEGSRTKAAIAASHFGISVKVSADGDITIYDRGKVVVTI